MIDECHRGSAAADSAWREILDYFQTPCIWSDGDAEGDQDRIQYRLLRRTTVYLFAQAGHSGRLLAPYKVVRSMSILTWMVGSGSGQTDKLGNVIEDREYGLRDWDKTIVVEQRNQLVAERTAEYLALLEPYAKTIVFCVDIAHAERMRQALVNAIGGEAAVERRCVMRITGDNAEGKAQLDNFIATEERYPVIATTSKLMTTGVDAKMCKVIVLDTVINSMTEFKQIVVAARGSTLRQARHISRSSISAMRRAIFGIRISMVNRNRRSNTPTNHHENHSRATEMAIRRLSRSEVFCR